MQRYLRDSTLAAAYPDADKNIGAALIPFRQWNLGSAQRYLYVLFGAVGFVLLIACVNVANLMLARSSLRVHEFAVRTALGAGQLRIVRQVLVESVLIATIGGAVGLLLAAVSTQAILRTMPSTLPRGDEIAIDARVFVFAMVVSLAAGLLFGLMPALKSARRNPQEMLQEGGRGSSGQRHRLQGILVGAEMALALVLLIGAGLMIRTLAALHNVNPGFDTDKVLAFGLSLPPSKSAAKPEAVRAMMRQVQEKLETAPGVQALAYTWGALPLGYDDEWLFWIDGHPKPASTSEMNWAIDYVVGPDYFKTMGLTLQSGRFFSDRDNEHAPQVAVIDEVFARKFFPGVDPVGQRLHLNANEATTQIIGVVNHIYQWGLDSDSTQELRAELFVPFMQLDDENMSRAGSGIGVVVRSDHPGAVFESIRAVNKQISNEQVVYGAQTMEEIIAISLADRRFSMILLGLFGGVALVLASVGIYGVVSYIVSQRTREIGIRIALGAGRRGVLRMVLSQAGKMVALGVIVGLVASIVLSRLMAGMLFGVSSYDPATCLGVALALSFVALSACYIPARRAMRVDPMVALRYE